MNDSRGVRKRVFSPDVPFDVYLAPLCAAMCVFPSRDQPRSRLLCFVLCPPWLRALMRQSLSLSEAPEQTY